MQDFTPEQLKEKFDQLPPQMQEAISSPEMLDAVKSIAQKHNLMIDQTGELVDQIVLIMLGLARSANFVSDASRRLSISEEQAKAIATDINAEIFDTLKAAMRAGEERVKAQEFKESNTSSLEKAGGFTIEKEAGLEHEAASVPTYKADALKSIQDKEPYTEPLVDQLLKGPAAIPQERIVRTVEETSGPSIHAIPAKPVSIPEHKTEPPVNLPTNDPYREAFK